MTPKFDQLCESILQEAKTKKKSKKRKTRNKSVKGWPWGPWGYWGGHDSSLHDVGGGSEGGDGGGE